MANHFNKDFDIAAFDQTNRLILALLIKSVLLWHGIVGDRLYNYWPNIQTMPELEFVDLVSCLMRVVWAAAAGKLYLAAMGIQVPNSPHQLLRNTDTGPVPVVTSGVDEGLFFDRAIIIAQAIIAGLPESASF